MEVQMKCYGGEQGGKEWKDYWDKPEVKGQMIINFWRPTNMKEPVRYKPLLVCDPPTINRQTDVIPTALCDFPGTISHTSQGSLKYNPN